MRSEQGRAALHSGTWQGSTTVFSANTISKTDNHTQKKEGAFVAQMVSIRWHVSRASQEASHSSCPLKRQSMGFFSNEMGSFHKDTCQVVKFKVGQKSQLTGRYTKTINFREHWPKINPYLVKGANKEPEESLLNSKELLGAWKHWSNLLKRLKKKKEVPYVRLTCKNVTLCSRKLTNWGLTSEQPVIQ